MSKRDGETVLCEVLLPHVRKLNGQLMMFEPLFSGVLKLPNDDDTKAFIDGEYLRVVESEVDDE